jgi:predicted DNA binding CopG/RHH family protein
MRTLEQRTELDTFEMEENYDFSTGVRGRFYQAKKVSTTIRLDNDILLFLKKKASEDHVGYQTLINSLLRDYVKHSIES